VGVELEQLDIRQASTLIDALKAMEGACS